MFVLIVGGGKVGSYLTRALVGQGHEVVIVEKSDRKARMLEQLLEQNVTVVGDGCDPLVLEQAGLKRADVVIADTGDDGLVCEDALDLLAMCGQQGAERVDRQVRGEGVDAVFEMLGGEHTAKSIRCLRDFGKVIQYGTATGKQPQLDVRALYAKAACVQGLWLTYLSSKRELMNQAWEQLSAWVAEGKLQPVVGHVLPAQQAAEGYRLLQERKNFGKVVLKIA